MSAKVETKVGVLSNVVTEEEERFCRMRKGIPLEDSGEIVMKGAGNPVAMASVLDFERQLFQRIREVSKNQADSPIKNKIIAALKSKIR